MAVLDASPIIYYSRIGELRWLLDFYRALKTTGAIVRETVDDARVLNKPGVRNRDGTFKGLGLRIRAI